MDNKAFGLNFLWVTAAALLFFGGANGGAFAIDRWLFPTERFGENTYIGTTDVSEMELEEAQLLFAGRVESWRSESELEVQYQDVTAAYPLQQAQILLDETVNRAESGTQNGFVFQLDENVTRNFLADHFPVAEFTDEQVAMINAQLESALADGQRRTVVAVTDEVMGPEVQVLAELSFPHAFGNPGAYEIAQTLSDVPLPPNETFSFLGLLAELTHDVATEDELTEMASALYGAALETNLIIEKRSIGAVQPDSIPLGKEAAVNRQLGIDLAITNPNPTTVYLTVQEDGGILRGMITGHPLVHQYSAIITNQVAVERRLVKQYSSFVLDGSRVEEFGADGTRFQVVRIELYDGEEVQSAVVSTDYYAPIHRVELFPLQRAEVEAPPADTNDGTITVPLDPNNPNGGTITVPINPNSNTGTGTGMNQGTGSGTTPGTGSGSGSGSGSTPGSGSATDNGSGSGSGTGSGSGDGSGSGSGNGSNGDASNGGSGEVKSLPPAYDKGGNRVNND